MTADRNGDSAYLSSMILSIPHLRSFSAFRVLAGPVILAVFFAVLHSGCKPRACVETPNPDCVCTMEYNPVCGCNEKTYPNACTAECNGIKTYTAGPCEKS